jgi:2-amino-4-hydroxy-6-hydroxymethyldihydropteridine diphosphokinase
VNAARVTAYVGMGANLGDARRALEKATVAMDHIPGVRVERLSSFYRTAPIGNADQPPFINAVAELDTDLPPETLLQELLAIETVTGRVRSFANAPRTLDLDLLLYDDRVIDTPSLKVPHPRMHERRFVLEPLLELAPDVVIPGRGAAAPMLAKVRGQAIARLNPEP